MACGDDCDKDTTKLIGVPALALVFAIEIVGITIILAVPTVVPATALVIALKVMVKFLPPLESCVVTDGNVIEVEPAAMVALPVNDVKSVPEVAVPLAVV